LNEPVFVDESKVKLVINEDSSVPSVGDDLIVMGLGVLAQGGNDPKFVHNVTVPVVSNDDCNKNNAYGGDVTDKMLCAGFLDTGRKDSCQGDSGGPLVQRTYQDDGTFVDNHVGVVSWGEGCALKNKPGVYARTSTRANWIKTTMCNHLNSIASFCNKSSPAPLDPCSQDLKIKVNTDTFASETVFILKDSEGKNVLTRKYLVNRYENEHSLCLQSNECYSWVFLDKYGDGMCYSQKRCKSYSFTLNGQQIASGNGRFKERIEGKFCTDAGGPVTPVASPTAFPTEVQDCTDSLDFRYKNKKKKTCTKWAGKGNANKVENKCNKKWKQIKVYDWCPEICGKKAGIGSCAYLRQKQNE